MTVPGPSSAWVGRERHGRARGGRVQETAHLGLGVEEPFDPPAQVQVRATDLIEVSGPGLGRLSLHRGEEDLVDTGCRVAHGRGPSRQDQAGLLL